MARLLWTACVLAVAAVSVASSRDALEPRLPPRLAHYLTATVKLTPEQTKALMGGAAVTKLLDADESKEVAVFGAIWINAPIRRYVEAVTDIERFERGAAYKVTKRISTPARLDDFAQLHLPEEDAADLRECRVGDCALKLGEQGLERFRTEIDWNAPNSRAAVDALMRQFALQYVNGYREGGNERLAVYRDGSRPTFVAREFREMVDQMPELTTYMPDVRRYLLGYPQVPLPGSTSFLYWQEAVFGLKPTIRISHLTIREGTDDALVASKMLYASHYFWTGLELRVLLREPSHGPGFWFITVNRSRSDGLSGFSGVFVRQRVRGEVLDGAASGLEMTKKQMEKAQ